MYELLLRKHFAIDLSLYLLQSEEVVTSFPTLQMHIIELKSLAKSYVAWTQQKYDPELSFLMAKSGLCCFKHSILNQNDLIPNSPLSRVLLKSFWYTSRDQVPLILHENFHGRKYKILRNNRCIPNPIANLVFLQYIFIRKYNTCNVIFAYIILFFSLCIKSSYRAHQYAKNNRLL